MRAEAEEPADDPPAGGWLARHIALHGPLTVAEYMTLCLHHPRHGYYATRPALGPEGDFITAPLVSQMFGELVGAWLAEMWRQMGEPRPVRLVEFGPGDGTLMQDALRVMTRLPVLAGALELWLVEPSRPLRAIQAERLASAQPRFVDSLDAVPPGAPLLVVANEVFDCLGARQFIRTGQGWAERRVGLDDTGRPAFGLGPLPGGAEADLPADAPLGAVAERSSAQTALATALGERLARDGGAALVFDYGADAPGLGDTLQALSRHRKVDPLESAGEADLTVHADFPAIAAAARAAGANASPIVGQGDFLRALGVEARASALARSRSDQAEIIARQLHRLTHHNAMGTLFKALALFTPGLQPPGFTPLEPAP